MDRKLTRPITPKRVHNQRSRRHNPLDQARPNRRTPRIAKIPKRTN